MENQYIKKSKYKKKKWNASKLISFDEEVVPKHIAQEILAKESVQCENKKDAKIEKKKKKREKLNKEGESNDKSDAECLNNEVTTANENFQRKRKNNKKGRISSEADEDFIVKMETKSTDKDETLNNADDDNKELSSVKKQKRKKKKAREVDHNEEHNTDNTEEHKLWKKRKIQTPDESECVNDTPEDGVDESSKPQKQESIRERKRKKHAQLLKDKKLKVELALQQKSLNYLSKWKHNKTEWKFEKLRQIWLQQNMYDSSKVPQEFWETLVEYLSQSKGKARDAMLKDALKIIEEENAEEDENRIKVERARDIIQNLQE